MQKPNRTLLTKNNKKPLFSPLYTSVAATIFFGLLFSFLVFFLVRDRENQRIQFDFNRAAGNRINSIKREIGNNIEALQSLCSLYKSNDFVTREEFRIFCKSTLLHHNDIQALEWIPRVSHSQRRDYEKKAQLDGYPDFQITRREAQGKMVRANDSNEYFPVYYLEPYKDNELALGFDLATQQTRLEALNKARDTGEVTATSRIMLVQERYNQFGFLVFMPLYNERVTETVEQRRENLTGFVLGVYKIAEIVEKSLTYLGREDIDVHIYDKSASQGEQLLYSHYSHLKHDTDKTAIRNKAKYDDGLRVSHTFDAADRKWLVLCKATPEFAELRKSRHPLFFLIGGLLVTGVFSIYMMNMFRKNIQIADLSAGLSSANTVRDRVEKSLRDLECDYKIIWNSISDVICIHDIETGNILDINKKAPALIEYSRQELEDMGIEYSGKSVPPYTRKTALGLIRKTVRAGPQSVECMGIACNGQLLCVEVNLKSVFINGRKCVMSVLRDITERKKIEETLVQSEKMKSLGELSAGIAHEFNNILTIISSNAQFVVRKYGDYKELNSELQTIRRVANDGANIVNMMYEFAKGSKELSRFVEVEVRSLIIDAINFTKPRWKHMAQEKGILYDMDVKDLEKVPITLGNPTELREVISNIINNAIDAMPDGGGICFETRRVEKNIRVKVSDTGKGMSADVMRRLFDPFFTTRSPEGTGLGMSVSYGIIKRHGGRIEVNSELGWGCTVTVYLPIVVKEMNNKSEE